VLICTCTGFSIARTLQPPRITSSAINAGLFCGCSRFHRISRFELTFSEQGNEEIRCLANRHPVIGKLPAEATGQLVQMLRDGLPVGHAYSAKCSDFEKSGDNSKNRVPAVIRPTLRLNILAR
jgi:hypothetical protein